MKIPNLKILIQFVQDKSREMNIFASIRIYFTALGIFSPQSNQKKEKNLKNVKSSLVLLLLILSVLSSILFIVYDAKTLVDRENAFSDTLILTSGAFFLAIYVWKQKTIFKFMMDLERIVQNS